jgi:O-antigen biosynthesis protein WbqP
MKRMIDLVLVAIAVKVTFRGPTIYWSDGVGITNELFKMPKFRKMKVDKPVGATHLLANSKSVLTPI